MSEIKPLTDAEEAALRERLRADPDDLAARNRLTVGVIRLVAWLVSGAARPGEDVTELSSAAMLEVVKLSRRFDPDSVWPWATQVRTATHAAIKRWRRKERVVPTTEQVETMRRNIGIARRELMQRRRREPTRAEIAAELQVNLDRVEAALDAPIVELDDPELQATPELQSPRDAIERDAIRRQVAEHLRSAVDKLIEQRRVAVQLVYLQEHTLRDAGQQLGISHEAVRLRIARALATLRGSI